MPAQWLDKHAMLWRGSEMGPMWTAHFQALCRFESLGFYVVFEAGTKGGTVVFETAPHTDCREDWAPIVTVDWVAQNRIRYVPLSGPYLALRARLIKKVVDGQVALYGVGQ